MQNRFVLSHRSTVLGLATAGLLSACGGGGSSDSPATPPHAETTVNTAGRITVSENSSKSLRVLDLDTGNVEATYQLDNTPSALYASSGGRYVTAVQRLQDQVQFVDAGVWQEDHVDHLHDYKQASRLVGWKLAGARPTHFDVQSGKQAAFFMDGNAAATPVQNASVQLITDASIATGNTVASLNLGMPIHGLGEPVDNKLLTVYRAPDAADTQPTHLELYQRAGSGYTLERRVATRCNGMHGSFSSGNYTVAGCMDGVLLYNHSPGAAVTDQKLTTAVRVSTLVGHTKLPGQFIGIGNEGVAPAVTTRFFAVSGDTASATAFTPSGWTTGHTRIAHGFDRSGTRFYILDNQGTLVVMQRQGSGWTTAARITSAIPSMPTAAPLPTFTANGARDEIYLTDPVSKQLVTVNSLTSTVTARKDLGYVPLSVVWTGISR